MPAPVDAQVVEARVDHSRVVDIMRRAGQLPLVKDYLLSVQKNNLLAVGAAGHMEGLQGGSRFAKVVQRNWALHCNSCAQAPLLLKRRLTFTLSPLSTRPSAGERGGERAPD